MTTNDASGKSRFFRWRLAIPPEKGGWIWWLGPLLVGMIASPGVTVGSCFVALGAFAAFCLRQPVTLTLRHLRRGHREDLVPPLSWVLVYLAILGAVAGGLLYLDHIRVVLLSALAAPVFVWHLVLVWKGADRHQMALDLLAALALALAAPAAFWAGGGESYSIVAWLWLLPGLQSASSVVHMFLRLEQRRLKDMPALHTRLRSGLRPMACHLLALLAALIAWGVGDANALVVVALVNPAAEGLYSVLRPQVRQTPKQLGMRQLAVSSASMLALAGAF